jgi:hypothetical protein
VLILPMLFGPFRPSKPDNRILLRYAPNGHGYIFSCTVIIFRPQVCAKSLNLGFDRGNEVELLFAPPAFELFFPSDGCVAAENVDVAAGHGKMLAVLVLGPGKTLTGPPSAGFGG